MGELRNKNVSRDMTNGKTNLVIVLTRDNMHTMFSFIDDVLI